VIRSELEEKVVGSLSPPPSKRRGAVIAWCPFEKAPVTLYCRFIAERAGNTNVQNPHDEERALAFMAELDERDLDAVSEAHPLALRPSAVARALGFHGRVVVHPRVADTTLGKSTEFMRPVTYLTFPAHRSEFTSDDTHDEAVFRMRKVVKWSKWDRAVAPALSIRYRRVRSGVGTTGGKRLGVAPLREAEQALAKIGDEDGFLEVENFERNAVTFRHERGAYSLETPSGSRLIDGGAVLAWLRCFVGAGLAAAERGADV